MVAPGLRGANGQPAAPPFSNGPYTMSESIAFSQGVSNLNTTGPKIYVSRNVGSSGNGISWDQAFLTGKEAFTFVNAAYAAQRQVYTIFFDEGWYGETPSTLTAGDTYIIGTAPGSHDSTVLYGSATAGGFDIGSGGPALTLAGSNCSIMNMGFFTHDNTEYSLQDGGHSGDTSGTLSTFNNRITNCNFIRDVNDGSAGGIKAKSNEGPWIDGCTFSTSCKDAGVLIGSNGSTNPVNVKIRNNDFIGIPTGVDANAGHNILVKENLFIDDTTDRPGTVTVPVAGAGATSVIAMGNWAEFANGSFVTGAGSSLEIDNKNLA